MDDGGGVILGKPISHRTERGTAETELGDLRLGFADVALLDHAFLLPCEGAMLPDGVRGEWGRCFGFGGYEGVGRRPPSEKPRNGFAGVLGVARGGFVRGLRGTRVWVRRPPLREKPRNGFSRLPREGGVTRKGPLADGVLAFLATAFLPPLRRRSCGAVSFPVTPPSRGSREKGPPFSRRGGRRPNSLTPQTQNNATREPGRRQT